MDLLANAGVRSQTLSAEKTRRQKKPSKSLLHSAGVKNEIIMADKRKTPRTGKRAKKTKNLDEFRKLNTKEAKGHLQYVFSKSGGTLQSLGVTHGKRTKGVNNVPLRKNPNPKDPEQAYVRPKITQEQAKLYGKRLDGLGLSAEDKAVVWELIERLRKKGK